MQSTDREEFEIQLARLCAGFNVPVTKHRVNAYWSGCAKMSLAQLSRAIDQALGEHGPDELPATKTLWKILRGGRTAAAKDVQTSAPSGEGKDGPSIQAQLCEYAAHHVHDLSGPVGMALWEYSRPWTYVYREWWDASRPKGFERCAECISLVIDLDNGKRIGWSVAAMLADTEGHAKVMQAFRPGPLPTEAQMRAYHRILPGKERKGSDA